jgi:hypothetical protein
MNDLCSPSLSIGDFSYGRLSRPYFTGRDFRQGRNDLSVRSPNQRLGSLDQLARRFDDSNTRSKRLETFSKQSSRYTWKKFIMVHHPENC